MAHRITIANLPEDLRKKVMESDEDFEKMHDKLERFHRTMEMYEEMAKKKKKKSAAGGSEPIAVALAEQHSRLQSLDEPHRFVYINRLNLVVRQPLQLDPARRL